MNLDLKEWFALVALLLNAILSFLGQRQSRANGRALQHLNESPELLKSKGTA